MIHIRAGKSKSGLQQEIATNLCKNHGFINLDITKLQSAEMDRGTTIGQEFVKLLQQDKNIPASLTVKMLNKILYCGQESLNTFILSGFPQHIDQVLEFELNCSKIQAIIYPTNQNSTTVEIPHKELGLFNIESLFQKEFRLKTMNEWSFQIFDEKLGNKVEYGMLVGKSMSGKSQTASLLAQGQGYTVIDMNKISEQVKAKLGTEEEPFEGDVPMPEVEKQITQTIAEVRANSQRAKFVFDGYSHPNEEDMLKFIDQFGCPEFVLFLTAEEKTIKERWMKKNEAEEVPEDVQETLKADS